jgi:hypothetical protein
MSFTARQNKPKFYSSRKSTARRDDPQQMLDLVMAMDRMLMEVSMQLYNVDRGERSQLRRQNRRLHAAVRAHLPRLLKPLE